MPDYDEGLRRLVELLVWMDGAHLSMHPETPPVYDAGLRYARPDAAFKGIGAALASGTADLVSLTAWRMAELRAKGEHATCRFVMRERSEGALYAPIVIRADGTEEDPAEILGLKDVFALTMVG